MKTAPPYTLGETILDYAQGLLSPTDVMGRCQGAIDARNPQINAIVHTNEADARRAAREASGRWAAGAPLSPIDGVPVVVKANMAVGGWPWTAALACFSSRIAEHDSLVVARLRDAGAVIAGIANMDEGALGATTSGEFYGPCQNPLRTGFTPGGSSGGSAAAVAAGFCLGAVGTDTMGSVRIPAAYCGVVGFKPGFSRIPLDGVQPLSPMLDHAGILARCVADVRSLYACLARDEEASAPAALPAGLRIGVCTIESPAIDGAVAVGLATAANGLRAASTTLGVFGFERGELEAMRKSAFLLCERDLAASLADAPDRKKLSSAMRVMLDFGARASEERLQVAFAIVLKAREKAARLFESFDALIMPTTPREASAHGVPASNDQADFTVFANAAGLPALAIPIGSGESGLPLSLQIITGAGQEQRALRLGEALEALWASQSGAGAFR